MAIVVRNEGAKINSSINVTPMVDVMLVLLIIFMVVAPMIVQRIPLPRTNHALSMPGADKEDALIVAVMRDGKIFFNTQQVSAEDLNEKLKYSLAGRTDKQVYVKADARCRYKTVVEIVDNVRSAGVDQLGLLTEQNRGTGAQP
jgi:biopolymer transport protein ExbD/biopolymer transport protein TolR